MAVETMRNTFNHARGGNQFVLKLLYVMVVDIWLVVDLVSDDVKIAQCIVKPPLVAIPL